MPIGAEIQPGGGVHFRVWAPRRSRVQVVLEPQSEPAGDAKAELVELTAEEGGYFSGLAPQAMAGSWYRFRLDDEPLLYPDPASRFQPDGVHGPSQVVDLAVYTWRDRDWRGVRLAGQIIYEMHVGTYTPSGTWNAAAEHLPSLIETGITLVEVMPVNEFPGRFGWGYDGVDLFAPTHLYGTPDEFRGFVDRAHELGLGVLLDVVYNHFGPSGNYLGAFSSHFMSSERSNEWGQSLNFDDEHSAGVREFFISNAGYWIDEFHLDGLRLDATQAIHDRGSPHVLLEISRRVRAAARGRETLIVSENERQQTIQLRGEAAGGYGLDGAWNDDFHHTAKVALTGRNEYYYADYQGTPQELLSALKWGYLYQGQRSMVQKAPRGTPSLDLDARQFIIFLENHDQVANSARGQRVHQLTSPGRHRAMTAVLLLAPATPMLFQGQEFSASAPFLYFADHEPRLAELVRKGRFEFLKNFPRVASAEMHDQLDDPENIATFERCKLDLSERQRHPQAYALHCDLIRLRKQDPVFSAQRGDRMHGCLLGNEAFALRFLGTDGDDRLLLVNLGRDERYDPAAEPLLAPPWQRQWQSLWSSEHPKYGGLGTPAFDASQDWRLPGQSAVVLQAVKETEPSGQTPPVR